MRSDRADPRPTGPAALPYLSFILAGRNDGYGGDLEARIAGFVAHLAHAIPADRLSYELVVCDWNPPAGRSMRDGFDWSALPDVRFVIVPPDLHAERAGNSGFPILDYIARNVAIRRARGSFVCVLNQDIYLSSPVAAAMADRVLDPGFFYRADRCDFTADFALPAAAQAARMAGRVFQINRRHGEGGDPTAALTVPVAPGTPRADWPTSRPRRGEVPLPGVPAVRAATEVPFDPRIPFTTHLTRAGLHTNAAGDFLLAARGAFEAIHGFVETADFYLHLDSYAVVQLRAAGLRRALFVDPAVVFHADHDRSGRLGRHEGMSYDAHEACWRDMLAGRRPYRLNGPDWGLGNHDLPEVTLRYGRAA